MLLKASLTVPVLSSAVERTGAPLSLLVRAGDFLFCSGMPPLDPETGRLISGDMAVQTHAVFKALKHALESAGSSLDKVVKTTVFVTNIAHFGTINEIYSTYFDGFLPARSLIAVGSWPLAFDIEIECIALA